MATESEMNAPAHDRLEPGSWARAIPWGLIGALGLVLGFERFVARHDVDLTGMVPLNWRYARVAAATEGRGSEVLCLGSSIVKFGVVSRAIEAETGKKTFNLAMCGAMLPPNYYVFERALAAGARPTAVVIDCLDNTMEPWQIYSNIRNWPELLDLGETLELAWRARDPDFLALTSLSRLSPSIKARYEIRNTLMAALRGQEASTLFENVLVRRNWRTNRGTQVMPRNLEFEAKHRGDAVRIPPQDRSAEGTVAGPPAGTYVRRFLDLAAAHGVRVFFLLPPLPPHTQEQENRSGQDRKRTRDALEAQAYRPDLVVIDGRHSGFASDLFYDDVHLNAHGAAALSAALGSALRRCLDAPGPGHAWVNLPPYRAPDPGPAMEDLIQSGLALKDEVQSRR